MKKRDYLFFGAILSLMLLLFACDPGSDDLTFDIATINLELPADSVVINENQPSFTWNGSGQIYYDFYLGLSSDLLYKQASGLSNGEYTINDMILQDTTYFWKVVAVSDDGFRESEVRLFTIE